MKLLADLEAGFEFAAAALIHDFLAFDLGIELEVG